MLIFITLNIIAIFEGNYLYQWVSNEYVIDKTFHISFNWIYWSSVIFWLYHIIFFFFLGFLLTAFTSNKKPLLFALAFGITYSVMRYSWSSFMFTESADAWTYFWSYGEYVMPLIGSMLGAFALIKLRGIKGSNKSLNRIGTDTVPPDLAPL